VNNRLTSVSRYLFLHRFNVTVIGRQASAWGVSALLMLDRWLHVTIFALYKVHIDYKPAIICVRTFNDHLIGKVFFRAVYFCQSIAEAVKGEYSRSLS
jgi:hypothetical protein